MQPCAERGAEQAAGIDDAVGLVHREAQWQGVDGLASLNCRAVAAFADDAADVGLLHRASADRPLHVEQAGFGLAAGQVDGDGMQASVRHVLRLADAGAHGFFRFLEIDDAAAAHTASAMPAEAEDAQRAVRLRAADQADDLGGADIEHTERTGAMVARALGLIGLRDRGEDAARHVVHGAAPIHQSWPALCRPSLQRRCWGRWPAQGRP